MKYLILGAIFLCGFSFSVLGLARGTALEVVLTSPAALRALESGAGGKLLEAVLGPNATKVLAGQSAEAQADALVKALQANQNNIAMQNAVLDSFQKFSQAVAQKEPAAVLDGLVAKEAQALAKLQARTISYSEAAAVVSATNGATKNGAGVTSLAKFAPKNPPKPDRFYDFAQILTARKDLPEGLAGEALAALGPIAKAYGSETVLGEGATTCMAKFRPEAVTNLLHMLTALSGSARGESLTSLAGRLFERAKTVFGETAEAASARVCSLVAGTPSGNTCSIFGKGFAPACK